jgi:hypothetical protein
MTFPRWLAPVLGALLGGLLILKGDDPGKWSPQMLALGMTLGAVAGGLVLLVDRPKTSGTEGSIDERSSGTVIGRAVAILAVPAGLIPVGNVVFAAAAVYLNRHCAGWPRVLSWIACGLSIVLSTVFVIALAQGR